MKRSYAVTIAGQRISLKSDADESYVLRLAEFVDERIRELQPRSHSAGPHEVAVLAALRIADDLFHERSRRADLRLKIRDQVQHLQVGLAARQTKSQQET